MERGLVTSRQYEIVLTFEDDRMGRWRLASRDVFYDGEQTPDLGLASLPTTAPSTNPQRDQTQHRPTAAQDPYVNDFTSSKFTVTIADDDPQPVFKFNDTNILLAEGNVQTVTVGVGVGAGGAGSFRGMAKPDDADSIRATLNVAQYRR